jgi:hypothetical protein
MQTTTDSESMDSHRISGLEGLRLHSIVGHSTTLELDPRLEHPASHQQVQPLRDILVWVPDRRENVDVRLREGTGS